MTSTIENVLSVILAVVSVTFFIFLGTILTEKSSMEKGAMEVYRGTTKLQYTIVDSVKVDSCVIFLNK